MKTLSSTNPTFVMQSLLSLVVIGFCMSQLAGDVTPDQTYWILLSSTIAYWFPSPTQAQKSER